MTQQELANKVHLTVQAVNQYESGKREVKCEMLVSLLKAMGYDFSIQETFEDRTVFALQEASLDETHPHIHFETTNSLEEVDEDEYNFGSFLTIKTCLLSEIKDIPCQFNRSQIKVW